MKNSPKNNLWKSIGKEDNLQTNSNQFIQQHENNKVQLIHDPYGEFQDQISNKNINQEHQYTSVKLKKKNTDFNSCQNYNDKNNIYQDQQDEANMHFQSPPRPKKFKRPPSLNIQQHGFMKKLYSQQNQKNAHFQELQNKNSSNNWRVQSSNFRNNQKNSNTPQIKRPYKKISLVESAQSPRSAWIDANGNKISQIQNKQNDGHDFQQFSVDHMDDSFLGNNTHQMQIIKTKAQQRQTKKYAESYQNPDLRVLKLKSRQRSQAYIPNSAMNAHSPMLRNTQGVQISRIRSPIPNYKFQNQQIDQVNQMFEMQYQNDGHRNNLRSKIGTGSKIVQFSENQREKLQYQLKITKQSLGKKDQIIFKLKLEMKFLSQKFSQIKKFSINQFKKIRQYLQNYKVMTILETYSQIQQKFTEQTFLNRKYNQNYLEQQYEKRKQTQVECQQLKKKVIEQDTLINGFQIQKAKLEKKLRQHQFVSTSSTTQLSSLVKKVKQLSDQKIQLKIQVQSLEERNKSMKQHINTLNKNLQSKASRQGDSEQDLHRKYMKLKKQLQQKQQEINTLRNNKQNVKRQHQQKLQIYEHQFRQVQNQMIEYKKRIDLQTYQLKQQIREQRILYQQNKQQYQRLQIKLKQKQLQHYKQIQKYDKTLRQIENDLQILSLKKNLKQQELNKKDKQLIELENELRQKYDDIRQERNQLQCAIQLYKKNLLLLQKKQQFMAAKYHQAVEIEHSSKAAWYERYYKLYSPSLIANNKKNQSDTNQKSKQSKINGQNQKDIKHCNNQDKNYQILEPPIYNDIKKMAITSRLTEIQNLKSNKSLRSRQQSPKQFRLQPNSPSYIDSRPQSPRSIMMINKARSMDYQRNHTIRSPLRERPQKDVSNKTNNGMVGLSIAKTLNTKPLSNKYNNQFSIVKAKIQQIKSSINNQIETQKNK